MRKVTTATTSAFLNRKALTMGNTHTDGKALYLHGNKIAWWEETPDWWQLWIQDCGFCTMTTRECLNGLYGVNLSIKKGQWPWYHLGSYETWTGKATLVDAFPK